jgi:hypothetical protein
MQLQDTLQQNNGIHKSEIEWLKIEMEKKLKLILLDWNA